MWFWKRRHISISNLNLQAYVGKVCIIQLDHLCFEKSSSTFWQVQYTVARTEHDALFKSRTKIFSKFVTFSENPNFTISILRIQFKFKKWGYLFLKVWVFWESHKIWKKSSSYFWQERRVLCAQQRTCQKVDEDFF